MSTLFKFSQFSDVVYFDGGRYTDCTDLEEIGFGEFFCSVLIDNFLWFGRIKSKYNVTFQGLGDL